MLCPRPKADQSYRDESTEEATVIFQELEGKKVLGWEKKRRRDLFYQKKGCLFFDISEPPLLLRLSFFGLHKDTFYFIFLLVSILLLSFFS